MLDGVRGRPTHSFMARESRVPSRANSSRTTPGPISLSGRTLRRRYDHFRSLAYLLYARPPRTNKESSARRETAGRSDCAGRIVVSRLRASRQFCRLAGNPRLYFLPGRYPGNAHFCLSRLRPLRLPGGVLSPRKFLAWGSAAVESLERLRHSFPRRVEHFGAIPVLVFLHALAAF